MIDQEPAMLPKAAWRRSRNCDKDSMDLYTVGLLIFVVLAGTGKEVYREI
ncbi:hypothetical protein BWQ96_08392 [Gracilariopsis chorda]|uniref:Uncharacterized protein n=1 Tax=Gracilariopsis chorda TaxID=448386 RepID=A0A2V3IL78_9FLOR|nr:hypothetical protein BWQ96_08392 [Gracilariopsis chorda]|eukprot:PXF41890.1 hypothetical protein BWQ96_08392 [Gracilariopsis chorda]